jgi:hypothetical protein
MRPAQQSPPVRAVAVLVGVFLAGLGLWAFVSPTSFYDSIAVFPPYNQHFLHDIGAFQFGLGVAMLLTQLWGDALLVVLTGSFVGATIHFGSHVIDRSLGGRPGTDLPVLGGVALVLLAGAILRYRQLAAEA